MSEVASSSDFRSLLAEIAHAAEHSVGVNSYEHKMVDLLTLIESQQVDRAEVVDELQRLATEWPWGAVETLEFTMRRLRWPEVRQILEEHRSSGADFRTRDLASQVLEVYQDDWPAGEIYDTYRGGAP